MLRELQALLGHLDFACGVIIPRRAFCRHLYTTTVGACRPHHFVRVTKELREELQLWRTLLEAYNGVSFWQQPMLLQADLQMHSDAASGASFGLFWKGKWCAEQRPWSWGDRGKNRDLAFVPIVVAVVLWADEFRNRTVHS